MIRQEVPFPSRKGVNQSNSLVRDMRDIVENIISSYEARIQSIGAIFDTTHQLLQSFENSFLDTKQERERLNTELRDNLAKNESLRKKDFDNMMQGILSIQERREKEVRDLLKSYLNEQKEMANVLRQDLAKVKDALAEGQAQRIKEFQAVIKQILAKQDERKEEVTARLNEFQKEQQEMSKRLKELLAKGRELRIKDLKSMLKELRGRRKERMVRQQESKEEVQGMLSDFRKERLDAADSWRAMQEKVAQRRTISPAAANTSV